VEPRPAATVVLLRPGAAGLEALLAHRPATMAFAPDMHVFPGGRVDAGDADPRLVARSAITPATAAEALGGDLDPAAAHAAYVAAIREAFEEAGVLLAHAPRNTDLEAARDRLLREPDSFAAIAEALDLRLRTDWLVPLSRWVTPPTLPRRFDARFFVAMLPDGVEATLVGDEVAAQDWWTPRAALDAMADGRLGLWLPTSATLQQLEHARSIDEIRDRLAPGRLGAVEAEAVGPDVVRLTMPAGGGVAGQPTCAYLVGRSSLVLVDPGDPTGPGLERAMSIALDRGGAIVAIALTSPDPDHAAGAEALAEQVEAPVFAAVGAGHDLPYEVRELADGDVLDVGDVPLRAVVAPGPRPDHLAFVIGDGGWVLAGDLDGVRGARAMPAPGDDAAWARSVARLRAEAPGARWLGGHPDTP
jgi:glyoxylase-like metal-dependent hydrolase (beta-lactamase superfamily II)/8-oxo-dGTP pyrophosphatase MutT (NUDIX family)